MYGETANLQDKLDNPSPGATSTYNTGSKLMSANMFQCNSSMLNLKVCSDRDEWRSGCTDLDLERKLPHKTVNMLLLWKRVNKTVVRVNCTGYFNLTKSSRNDLA